jgi:hypothetical protein
MLSISMLTSLMVELYRQCWGWVDGEAGARTWGGRAVVLRNVDCK